MSFASVSENGCCFIRNHWIRTVFAGTRRRFFDVKSIMFHTNALRSSWRIRAPCILLIITFGRCAKTHTQTRFEDNTFSTIRKSCHNGFYLDVLVAFTVLFVYDAYNLILRPTTRASSKSKHDNCLKFIGLLFFFQSILC